jgi:hypothetical protein
MKRLMMSRQDLSAYAGWMCIHQLIDERWAVALTGPGMQFAAYSHTNGAIRSEVVHTGMYA